MSDKNFVPVYSRCDTCGVISKIGGTTHNSLCEPVKALLKRVARLEDALIENGLLPEFRE